MEIKQLETFVSVAKNLSFSKAAEELYLSQSTVSVDIGSLEKSLGVQLLIRNSKEVSLTNAGFDFLAYAKKILTLREQAIHSISGEDRDTQGNVSIISSTIPAQHLLPEIIALFKKQWPNIVFRVDQLDSRRVEQVMSGFKYDFGMVGTISDYKRFVHYPVYDDELVLVVPGDTPESPEIIRENFTKFVVQAPFIMREQGSGTRTEVEALLVKFGVDPRSLRIAAYFSDTHSILMAVSRGMGISLVSKVAASVYERTGILRIVEIDDLLFRRQIHILHNKELWLSPLQQAFFDHACSFYRSKAEK